MPLFNGISKSTIGHLFLKYFNKPADQAPIPSYLCPCLTCLTSGFAVWEKNAFPRSISGRAWGGGTLKFRNHLALPRCFKWRSGGDMSCPVSSREPLGSRDQSSSLLASVLMFTLRASSYFLLLTKPAPLKPPSCGHVPRVSNAYDNTV